MNVRDHEMRLKDHIYLEAHNACAVCGSRDSRILTIHHIDGDSSNSVYENEILMCEVCHVAYNKGHGVSDEDVKVLKRRLIIETLTAFGINAIKATTRRKLGYGPPYFMDHLVALGYLEFIRYDDEKGLAGPETVPVGAFYGPTDRGKTLLKEWDL